MGWRYEADSPIVGPTDEHKSEPWERREAQAWFTGCCGFDVTEATNVVEEQAEEEWDVPGGIWTQRGRGDVVFHVEGCIDRVSEIMI